MILPGTLIGLGLTVRDVIWNGSEAGPQFDHEKPKIRGS